MYTVDFSVVRFRCTILLPLQDAKVSYLSEVEANVAAAVNTSFVISKVDPFPRTTTPCFAVAKYLYSSCGSVRTS